MDTLQKVIVYSVMGMLIFMGFIDVVRWAMELWIR